MSTIINNVRSSQQKNQYLSQVSMFQSLSQREMAEISRTTTSSRVLKGHIFYRPEEMSQLVYILIEGRVHLYRINPDGKKIIVATLGPQALFDEVSLVGDGIHYSFAEAIEPCRVLMLGRMELKRLMMSNPHLIMRVLEKTCSRLNSVEEKLESVAFKGIASRISELLLHLAREQGDTRVTGFTHQDLAESVGTYRETTTQVLNELKSLGYIDIGRKQIEILNPVQLAAVI